MVIGGMLLGEKSRTNASWENIIKAEFGEILFVLFVGITATLIIRIFKDN